MGQPRDVFKAYDIRGVVPDQLDAPMCRAIGAAVARFTGARRLLVARDMRPSGVELAAAFAEGARGEGTAVTDLGMASTDFLYFAAGRLDAPGAMFTASHNPAQYNGIKLCLAGARPIGRDTGLGEIEALAVEALAEPVRSGPLAPLDHQDLLAEYAEHARSFVDLDALRPLKVVADTANGMGGLVVPLVMGGLPFDV
ncbi:MAG: phosphomannomutase/phosphoglucomutase, partial [Acidimicrobiales bacterium]